MFRCDVWPKLAVSYGVVMTVVTVFGGALGAADVDCLAIPRRNYPRIMDAAIFNQTIGTVISQVNALGTNIVHLTVQNLCVIGVVQHDAFLGIRDL